MQTYQISIDEEQRAIIVNALELILAADTTLLEKMSDVAGFETIFDHAEILKQMFDNLPSSEEDAPRALHGFCL